MAGTKANAVKLNNDTNILKVVAMLSMVCDHVGKMFFPQLSMMRIIGRLAFPIYAYCIAVGCVYTRNPAKYALRVLVLAVISQPIYVLALGHVSPAMTSALHGGVTIRGLIEWYGLSMRAPNILFTLLLGILIIASIREQKYIATGVFVLLTWYVSGYINYGWRGVALMLIFYAFLDRPTVSFVWAFGFMAWWGLNSGNSYGLAGMRFGLQMFAVFALPLIHLRMDTGLKLPKWLFYFFYPAHLAAIYVAMLLK